MTALATKTGEVKYVRKVKSIPYDCGVYGEGNMTFECTEFLAPYVYYRGEYYVMNRIGTWVGEVGGLTPQSDYALHGNKAMWLLMEKAKITIFESLIAEFAAVGSAIFNGIYTYSHYGIDSAGNQSEDHHLFDPTNHEEPGCPFRPNFLIDWMHGSMRANNVSVEGTFRAAMKKVDPTIIYIDSVPDTYQSISDVIDDSDYIWYVVSGSLGGNNRDNIPSDKKYIGRKIYLMFQTTIELNGRFVYGGQKVSTLSFSQQSVEMFCVELDEKAYWLILGVNDLLPVQRYGFAFKTLAYGRVTNYTGSSVSTEYRTFDGTKLLFDRYANGHKASGMSIRIRMPSSWFHDEKDVFVQVTGYGPSNDNKNQVFANVRNIFRDPQNSYYMCVEVIVADDPTWNSGEFFFEIKNMRDFSPTKPI